MGTTRRIWPLTMLVALCLGAAGCGSAETAVTTKSDNEERPMTTTEIGEERAVELASEELRKAGWIVEDHDITVEEKETQWNVTFVRKPPTPPGGEAMVMVKKSDGSCKTMWGE